MELFDSRGKKLREIAIDDCTGAPHEARGVGRAALVGSLATRSRREDGVWVHGTCPSGTFRRETGRQYGGGGGVEIRGRRARLAPPLPRARRGRRREVDARPESHRRFFSVLLLFCFGFLFFALLKPLRYVGYTAYRGIASFPEGEVPPCSRGTGSGCTLGRGPRRNRAAWAPRGRRPRDQRRGKSRRRPSFRPLLLVHLPERPDGDKTKITEVPAMRADALRAVSSADWDLPATGVKLLQFYWFII